jgi:uncharacterized protein (DUF488 family)
MNGTPTLFTIGHSTHELPTLVKLLKRHGVTAVADVRSQPRSRLEHFCRPALEAGLKADGLKYVFLGRELGARRDEPECYIDDRADYDRIARLPAFAAGMERIERGARSHLIALVCAEKDPLDCHRMVLVSRFLARRGMIIAHILADGSLEVQADAERRLVRLMRVERTLFEPDMSDADLVERAYNERGLQIAYRKTHEGAME